MRSTVNKNILGVAVYQPGKPIEEVKRELGLREVVKLASNESPYGPPPQVLRAIAQASRNLNRYPDGGCFQLRRELSARLKVAPEQLIFGNGSDEIIVMAIRAFTNPGDEVVVARPSFLIYEIASKLAGAKVKEVPLKNFRYDLEGMRRAVTAKTRIIFIGNPDNPAGTYVTASEVNVFLKGLRKDILVFFDEAYFEFVDAKDYPDTLRLLKTHKNIIVTRTFSKMYGLAGLRIGYGIADAEVIDYMNRLREPFNVNSLAQAAAVACLKNASVYKGIARAIKAEKQFLYEGLAGLNVRFKESATNFILIDVGRDSSEVSRQLLKKGVIIRDMNFWGLKNIIRVTVGTRKENQKLLKALKAVL